MCALVDSVCVRIWLIVGVCVYVRSCAYVAYLICGLFVCMCVVCVCIRVFVYACVLFAYARVM